MLPAQNCSSSSVVPRRRVLKSACEEVLKMRFEDDEKMHQSTDEGLVATQVQRSNGDGRLPSARVWDSLDLLSSAERSALGHHNL